MIRFATCRSFRLALTALVCSATTTLAGADHLSPAGARLKADVAYLADDAREGRGPGTAGIEAAAEYIAEQFKQAGLKAAAGADGYFQPFSIPGDQRLAPTAKLVVTGPDGRRVEARPDDDFSLISTRGATLTDVPLVFAGYGITAKDEKAELDYDDYADVDVKGKAVLIFRNEPRMKDESSPFDGKALTDHATFRRKATNAAEHGAVAVLLVNNAAGLAEDKDEILPDGGAGRLALPVVMLTRETAGAIVKQAGLPSLDDLEAQIDEGLKLRSTALNDWSLGAAFPMERKSIACKNVVGVLDGSGPLAEETIVVGAHFDHLGRGGAGSLRPSSREIHNGADDNASGTAMMIEMARRLAARRPDPLPRRIVFIAFSGEERGLLGSAHYVKEPLYPLQSTVAMINFDMVGRLNDKHELTIFGAGSTPGLDALVESLGKSQGLTIKKVVGTGGEFFASDHASFYVKDVPVLFAFTGNHRDYHAPSDDIERINFDGMARIADLSELLLLDLARRPERPAFVKLGPGRGRTVGAARTGSGAYLGTRPAYGESDTPGVALDGVTEGGPAEKAGLKSGDIIIRFDGKHIKDIEDFMDALGKKKPGDAVEVVVKRGPKEETLKATLGTSPSRAPRD